MSIKNINELTNHKIQDILDDFRKIMLEYENRY